MPLTSSPQGPVCPEPPLAAEANARIRELYARAEGRPLTDVERAEYERLRGVYVRAVLAA